MELSSDQIDFIGRDVRRRGIVLDDLAESLVDHLCCTLENGTESDFDRAYAAALEAFGQRGLVQVQRETFVFLILKRKIAMKKAMYLLGYLATCLTIMGMMFKLLHWPGANVMLVVGLLLLSFGYLPLYFYDRYQQSKADLLQEAHRS
ncbi:hypothetical protein SAMN05421823_11256 [Catalinimonas alkaloidigena]|uniref:Gliding motility protein GldL-like N-terminal domain-containing protein n=1 Tax=Catalinimonas alkaloidigena TaxID=1075417 RepID=A0A1G9S7X5_9BACT|nr:hypothetical protein [Catalinimonas alkaloidigena]SDM31407.1 hypothetical protein SAMN05421823_11256 [Catalinimonas alkaloidigena]